MNIKRIRKAALWTVLLLVAAVFIALFLPVSPQGRFSTPTIGNDADAYLEFADGKAATVAFGGRRGREGQEFRDVIGNYRKERGRWILISDSDGTCELRATLLSLTIVYDNGHREGPYYRYEIYKGR